MKLLDLVELLTDVPEEGLRAGQQGTIVHEHGSPSTAYEVEIVTPDGDTLWCGALESGQLKVVWESPK